MKVIGQADLDINESDWAIWIQMKVIWQEVLDINEIVQAVLDINESDCASGSGYK